MIIPLLIAVVSRVAFNFDSNLLLLKLREKQRAHFKIDLSEVFIYWLIFTILKLNQIVEISLNHLESSELCMTINNEGRILFPILMHKPVVNLEVLICPLASKFLEFDKVFVN